nr:hypothetical protein Q903MT_gene811 [Picea sitchensis]
MVVHNSNVICIWIYCSIHQGLTGVILANASLDTALHILRSRPISLCFINGCSIWNVCWFLRLSTKDYWINI